MLPLFGDLVARDPIAPVRSGFGHGFNRNSGFLRPGPAQPPPDPAR
jgi:hypothetical protein